MSLTEREAAVICTECEHPASEHTGDLSGNVCGYGNAGVYCGCRGFKHPGPAIDWKARAEKAEAEVTRLTNEHAQRDAANLIKRDQWSAMNARLAAADAALAAAEQKRDALAAFKAYVHQRLDDAGIPVDPPSSHRDAGCRIGGRLDALLAKVASARAVMAEEAARYAVSEEASEAWAHGTDGASEQSYIARGIRALTPCPPGMVMLKVEVVAQVKDALDDASDGLCNECRGAECAQTGCENGCIEREQKWWSALAALSAAGGETK